MPRTRSVLHSSYPSFHGPEAPGPGPPLPSPHCASKRGNLRPSATPGTHSISGYIILMRRNDPSPTGPEPPPQRWKPEDCDRHQAEGLGHVRDDHAARVGFGGRGIVPQVGADRHEQEGVIRELAGRQALTEPL